MSTVRSLQEWLAEVSGADEGAPMSTVRSLQEW